MLDFSQRRELSLHAEVAAEVNSALAALHIRGIVVGAFARDSICTTEQEFRFSEERKISTLLAWSAAGQSSTLYERG